MDAHQICFQVGFSAPSDLGFDALLPVFHGFIQQGALPDDVMIDVAEYSHVPNGPGVLLVCHEGHYGVARHEGQWSLRYNRKRGGQGDSLEQRLAVPFRRLMTAAQQLAAQGLGLGFDTGHLRLQIQDRLHAQNDGATFDAIAPTLKAFLTQRYGVAPSSVVREGEARELFTVRITCDERPPVDVLATR